MEPTHLTVPELDHDAALRLTELLGDLEDRGAERVDALASLRRALARMA